MLPARQRKVPTNQNCLARKSRVGYTKINQYLGNLFDCIKPCVLVPSQHPLSLAISSTRLHLRHHVFEIDEVRVAGRRFAFPERFFPGGAALQASSVLHLVHKFPQAFVRVSLQRFDLGMWDGGTPGGGNVGRKYLPMVSVLMVAYNGYKVPTCPTERVVYLRSSGLDELTTIVGVFS